jgi:hypothetical protein
MRSAAITQSRRVGGGVTRYRPEPVKGTVTTWKGRPDFKQTAKQGGAARGGVQHTWRGSPGKEVVGMYLEGSWAGDMPSPRDRTVRRHGPRRTPTPSTPVTAPTSVPLSPPIYDIKPAPSFDPAPRRSRAHLTASAKLLIMPPASSPAPIQLDTITSTPPGATSGSSSRSSMAPFGAPRGKGQGAAA